MFTDLKDIDQIRL